MVAECAKIGDCTLYLGDCRDVMPELADVDVVLTDPVWPNCPAELVAGWEDPVGLFRDACRAMPGYQRIVVVLRSDSDPRFLSGIPVDQPFFRAIQLPYVLAGFVGRKLMSDELAYWYGAPILFAPGRKVVPGRAPLSQPEHRPANGHPMSRSQMHFDWLVSWCSDAGETVLDPFMGSGTTGVACAKAGRPFVGVEIEPRYFDIACERIEAAYRQRDLFVQPFTWGEQIRMELGDA